MDIEGNLVILPDENEELTSKKINGGIIVYNKKSKIAIAQLISKAYEKQFKMLKDTR